MSKQLTPADVAKVAVLSRLQLTDQEQSVMTEQLGKVLNYVEMLEEVDTSDVEPVVHAIPVTNMFRADVEQPSLPRAATLSNAPQTDQTYFLVPAILDSSQS